MPLTDSPQNHLWSNVLWCAEHLLVRELPCLFVNVAFIQIGGQGHEAHLAEAEVSQLDVAKGSDQQVVRLEVSVNDAITGRQVHLINTAEVIILFSVFQVSWQEHPRH